MNEPDPNTKWRLRFSFLRFSLRFFLLIILAMGCFFGWAGREIGIINREQALIEQISEIAESTSYNLRYSEVSDEYLERNPDWPNRDWDWKKLDAPNGVSVLYDYQLDESGKFDPDAQPPKPNWASRLITFMNGHKSFAIPFCRIRAIKIGRIESDAKVDLSTLNHLQTVKFESIKSIKQLEFPSQIVSIQIQDKIDLEATGLSKFCQLKSLTSLKLEESGELQNLDALNRLPKLKELDLGSPSLKEIATNKGLPHLEQLSLETPMLNSLHGIENSTKLKRLSISGNRFRDSPLELESLDGLVGLTEIEELKIYDGNQLSSLKPIAALKQLKTLELTDIDDCAETDIFGSLDRLELLWLSGDSWQSSLDPNSLSHLKNLKQIYLSAIDARDLNWISQMGQLNFLELKHASSLKTTRGVAGLEQLSSLVLRDCSSLEDLAGIDRLPRLTHLLLYDANRLSEIDSIGQANSLTDLTLTGAGSVKSFDSLNQLANLKSLSLGGSDDLESVDCIDRLTNLETLFISNCPSLENLNGLHGQNALYRISIGNCNSLTNLNGIHGLHDRPMVSIWECDSITQDVIAELERMLPGISVQWDGEEDE